MKRLIYLIVMLISVQLLYSANGQWQWYKPYPCGTKTINQMSCVNQRIAWATNETQSLFYTDDTGLRWRSFHFDYGIINKVQFINQKIGWIKTQAPNSEFCRLIKTTNSGQTWSVIREVYVKIHDFLIVDENIAFIIEGNQLFKSSNGGLDWTKLNFQDVGLINNIQKSSNTIFVNGESIVAYSTDNGTTWNYVESPKFKFTKIVPDKKNVLWTCKNSGLFRSTNFGADWELKYTAPADISDIAIYDDTTYISASQGKIFRSYDDKTTWDELNTGFSCNFLNVYMFNNKSVYACGEKGNIYVSTNYGKIWKNTTSFSDKNLFYVKFSSNDYGWIAGEDGVLMKTSDDGATWVKLNQPLKSFNWIQVDDDKSIYLSIRDSLAYSNDGGASWSIKKMGSSSGIKNKLYFMNKSTVWAFVDSKFLYKSNDGGSSWTKQSVDTLNNLRDICFIDELNGWVVGDNGTFYKTSNAGNTWSYINLAKDNNLKDIHFFNSKYGWILAENYILKTTNSGANWNYEYFTEGNYNSIYFVDELHGWLVGNNSYAQTTDGGKTWEMSNINLPGIKSLNSIWMKNINSGYAVGADGAVAQFVGTSKPFFATENGDVEISAFFGNKEIPFKSIERYTIDSLESMKLHYPFGAYKFTISSANLPKNASARIEIKVKNLNINACQFLNCAPRLRKVDKNGDWNWLLPTGYMTKSESAIETHYPFTKPSPDMLVINYNITEGSQLDLDPSNDLADPFGIVYVEEIPASVESLELIEIKSKSVIASANISKTGGSLIAKKGFVLDINSSPRIENANNIVIVETSGLGKYQSNVLNLKPNTKYYIRAFAINASDTSYSNEIEFTTSKDYLAMKTLLEFPANSSSQVKRKLKLSWKPLEENAKYEFVLAADNAFTNIITSQTNLTSTTTEELNLAPNMKYFWKVRATVDDKETSWSEAWWFVTEDNTSVGLSDNESLMITPNPASDYLKIKYNLECDLPVSIKIYNEIGELLIQMDNLKSEDLIVISDKSLTQGVYYLNLHQGYRVINSVIHIQNQ